MCLRNFYSTGVDILPFLATLFGSLFLSLEYGIIIGIGTNLLFVLYSTARPPVSIHFEKLTKSEVCIITPSRNLHFPAAEFLNETVMKSCTNENYTVVIDGKYMSDVDSTVAKVRKNNSKYFYKKYSFTTEHSSISRKFDS